jgi:hypothetical protein
VPARIRLGLVGAGGRSSRLGVCLSASLGLEVPFGLVDFVELFEDLSCGAVADHLLQELAPVEEQVSDRSPPTLVPAPRAETASMASAVDEAAAAADPWLGRPVELDQVVPSSGNMWLAGRQFWRRPARAGLTVRFWASGT